MLAVAISGVHVLEMEEGRRYRKLLGGFLRTSEEGVENRAKGRRNVQGVADVALPAQIRGRQFTE